MNNLVCEHCEADIQGCEHYPVKCKCIGGDSSCPCQDGDPCHYEGENAMKPLDLVHEMCELITKMNAISERMNHFEAWFSNIGDRMGTIEKRQDAFAQMLKVWVDGRGGMS